MQLIDPTLKTIIRLLIKLTVTLIDYHEKRKKS